MDWEIVPDWTDRNGPEKQAFRRLDEALGSDERATIRLRADSSEQAMLTPVSILMSASAAVKVTGPVSEDRKAGILFLSSGRAVSAVAGLLDVLAREAPGASRPRWMGVPAGSLAGVRQSGTVVVRDKNKEAASFGLYPLARDSASAPSLQPAKEKLPESRGNLRDREAWFRRRSGGTPDKR